MSIAISKYYLDHIIFTLIALMIAIIVAFIAKNLIDVVFRGVKTKIGSPLLVARTRTIRSLLKNIIDVIVYLMVILIILAQWNINIMPILTGAGILGLAVSFGSQTLVKDLISGFFILLEGQYNVGDKIKLDKAEGYVYNITLRLTVLRDKDDNFIYIPNSQITLVTRYSNKPKSNGTIPR